jgi:hypothetical protein
LSAVACALGGAVLVVFMRSACCPRIMKMRHLGLRAVSLKRDFPDSGVR